MVLVIAGHSGSGVLGLEFYVYEVGVMGFGGFTGFGLSGHFGVEGFGTTLGFLGFGLQRV